MVNIRILLVDDFEPWRRFVSSTLQKSPGFEIVLEVSDGLQAVQKAAELDPDLILLDIGLPGLNGIEAARRIRKVAPHSKIIFLTEDSAEDIAEEAFRIGAAGYVVKSDAARELLSAMQTVLSGQRFSSARLHREAFSDVPERQAHLVRLSAEGFSK
jgi:DNA-binding NarL/FixJ family response regulator